MTFVYINNMQFFVNKMYQQYDGHINDLRQYNSCHNMEPSWISRVCRERTYFIIDKIWQIQSRYVINTTLPGVFSIRSVFGLGAVFARVFIRSNRCRICPRPSASGKYSGHLSQIPGRILKTPGNIVYIYVLHPLLYTITHRTRPVT